jgi:serine/threonine protein kinase
MWVHAVYGDSQEKCLNQSSKFDEQDWRHISEEAKDLITAMLQIDIDSQLSAADALKPRWIMKAAELLACRDLSQSLQIIKEKRPRLEDLARVHYASFDE